jgi:hypothetical protein
MVHKNTQTHTECENEDVTVLWNLGVHTDRKVTENRPVITIKNKKRENIYTSRCSNTCGQKCHAKGSRKEAKIQGFMYRKTTNMEHAMCDYTSNNWSH